MKKENDVIDAHFMYTGTNNTIIVPVFMLQNIYGATIDFYTNC